MPVLISFKNIEKGFGKLKVIRDLDLEIEKKEMFGLIGPSGAGKSTLLKILIGFYKVDAGSVVYEGRDITNKTNVLRRAVGFCTQENSFYPELTVQENLRYYGRMYSMGGKLLKARIMQLLHLVKLENHKKTLAGKISGGMKRRLDFAIALLHNPELLILDEPTTGLDPVLRKELWKLITEINREGKTILIITHDIDMIEEHCTKIGILDKGRITHVGTPKELRKSYPKAKEFTEVFEKMIA